MSKSLPAGDASTDRQGAVIYNLGALILYVSLVMLLLDALHVAARTMTQSH